MIGVTNALELSEYSVDNQTPNWADFTDGAGHGILIATDNIFLTIVAQGASIDGVSYNFAGQGRVDLLYRFKEITLQEYIGIVQSQQS